MSRCLWCDAALGRANRSYKRRRTECQQEYACHCSSHARAVRPYRSRGCSAQLYRCRSQPRTPSRWWQAFELIVRAGLTAAEHRAQADCCLVIALRRVKANHCGHTDRYVRWSSAGLCETPRRPHTSAPTLTALRTVLRAARRTRRNNWSDSRPIIVLAGTGPIFRTRR